MIYGWLYELVQAGNRYLSDCLFTGHDADCRPDGAEQERPSGTGDHAGGRGGAEDCRTVWAGYQYQGEPDEQCVCSPERGKPDQDHCTGSGEIGGTDWRPG